VEMEYPDLIWAMRGWAMKALAATVRMVAHTLAMSALREWHPQSVKCVSIVEHKNTKNVADGLRVCDVKREQKTDQTLGVHLDPASRCLEDFVLYPVLCG